MIQLKYSSTVAIDSKSFLIYIDNVLQDYTISSDEIIIDDKSLFGNHTLKIECNNNFYIQDDHIKFVDFVLNGSSIRHALYLGYALKDNQRQFTTIINKDDLIWHLPFGNPLSWWLAECMSNIPNNFYGGGGKDINESLEIHFPESIKIDEHYPPLIKDFFLHNFGFTAYKKQAKANPLHRIDVPYLKVNLDYDEKKIHQEFIDNIEILENQEYIPGQIKYNSKEQPDKKPWYINMAIFEKEVHISQEKFPEYHKLLNSLKGLTVHLSFIGTLHPGSYISPHIDDVYQYLTSMGACKGLCQLFIPIGWKEGNYFKASKVGLLPWHKGALLFNNTTYPHASINQSDEVRFTIGLMCEFHDDTFLQYIEK